ncbi:MAG: hypothetical protein GX639_07265 [Fibrobacter sp.]|nr:hypothetical protein [Fibrobacter sp.]
MKIAPKITAVFLLLAAMLSAQSLTGSFTITLKGPATGDQINIVKAGARTMLKNEIISWLKTSHEFKFDTTNVLTNLAIEILTDSCINHGKEESSFKGRELSIFYTVTEAAADDALNSFDRASEEFVRRNIITMQNAEKDSNNAAYFKSALIAYCYSYGHFGEPIILDEATGVTVVEETQKIVHNLFNRLKIQSSDMILQGRIGRAVDQPPIVTAVLDSTPINDLWFCGYLQSGKYIYAGVTDDQGQLTLKDMMIPLVSNGTLYSLTPDIGKTIGAPVSITLTDLKIQVKDGHTQTFMFKVIQPTYSLDYKISSGSDLSLPPEFLSDAVLKKYLKDSCFVVDTKPNVPPDFMITADLTVANAAVDITDEMGLKVTGTITIKGLSLETPRTEIKNVEYIKRYAKRTEIPYGLALWDMNMLMKQNMKSILSKM